MKNMLLASAAVVAMIGHAEAQEAGYNWSGFYIGAQAGYGWSSADFNGIEGSPPFGGSLLPDEEHNEDGLVGGIHVGHDWQQDRYVFGAVADVDFIDADQVRLRESDSFGPFGNKSEAYTYDIDWLATARVRAGYLPTERLLVYGTGGLAVGHFEVSTRQRTNIDIGPIDIDETFRASDSSVEVGGVVGLGAEFALASNWSLKTEYLHYDFNSVAIGGSTFEPSLDTVKVGLSYRFGP